MQANANIESLKHHKDRRMPEPLAIRHLRPRGLAPLQIVVQGERREEEREEGDGGERDLFNIFHIPLYTFIYLHIPLYTLICFQILAHTPMYLHISRAQNKQTTNSKILNPTQGMSGGPRGAEGPRENLTFV